MSKNYGIPYMGSKNSIVNDIIFYILQRHYDAKYFIDVFTGGFAVSHYVLENTNKMTVLANDLNEYVISLYEELFYNKGKNFNKIKYDFIDRELFNDVKNNPDKYEKWYVGYVLTIWSFGNSQQSYMYGKDIEDDKKALHNAIVNNDFNNFIWDFRPSKKVLKQDYKKNIIKRLDFLYEWKQWIKKKKVDNRLVNIQNLNQQERLISLEHITRIQHRENAERLQHITRIQHRENAERLQLSNMDYKKFIESLDKNILENAVVYCDPPYEDTETYQVGKGFNYDEFWQWFREANYPIYVSSYKAPDDIKTLNFEFKNQLLSGGVGKKVKENLYWNGKGDYEPTLEDLLFNE